ncbi:1-acyl-sn-glycerol-3-phosphate acyltransferase [Drechslerella dactyloides]|uniref:1-acyl-sn-glycerol-3-phosphate acyltransferase n=1 Tax=Drechslerella dactyloides TaxID=74499 RepID=A0AAD6J2U1_DREDA|nr:1-acyl-sn-glycerol-3-phosphate acyltransferase [Drechslerella dactyloides]
MCCVSAKSSLKHVPFLGWFMTLSGTVFIDRANRQSALSTFDKAAAEMKSRRQSVWIFPEGTRSYATTPMLLPFKKGAFHLAVQAQVPIVPVVVQNYSHVLNVKARTFESGTVKIKVLPAVSTAGMTGTKQEIDGLVERVRTSMLVELEAMGMGGKNAKRDARMPLIRWLLDVQPLWNSPDEFNAALHHLPATTHAHIQNYHRPSDRKLALASQLLQHLLVSRHLHIPFPAVSITRHHCSLPGARPVYGDETNGIEYSVSHHGSVVALVSRLLPPKQTAEEEGSVGVDVLSYTEPPSYVHPNLSSALEWAEGFTEGGVFTSGEMEGIRAAAATDGWEAVVKEVHLRWAVKEAYVKALGTGLATDLTGVEARVEGVRALLEEEGRRAKVEVWLGREGQRRCAEGWYVEVERVGGAGGRYCVALATRVEGLEEGEKGDAYQKQKTWCSSLLTGLAGSYPSALQCVFIAETMGGGPQTRILISFAGGGHHAYKTTN